MDGAGGRRLLRIATRGSHLALAQSRYIQQRIAGVPNAPPTELIVIKTSGDINQTLSLAETASTDQRKGLFTKEIEDALLEERADIAVHSFKDLPTKMFPGLEICAIPQRLESLDVLVFPRVKKAVDHLPYLAQGSTIGTSSARRVSQLAFRFPGLTPVLLRGNVPTRISRLLEPGGPDAILLSGAGIERLIKDGTLGGNGSVDISPFEMVALAPELMVPAPAQGALAVQCRTGDTFVKDVLYSIHDSELEQIVKAERKILAGLEGGCHLPLGSHAESFAEAGRTYKRLHIFLGREAAQNRRNYSYQFVRAHRDAAHLATLVLEEILRQYPIVLTGRKERSDELKARYSNTISLPMIRTETLPVPEGTGEKLRAGSLTACFFSVTAVRAAARIPELKLPDVQFACVGAKTAAALEEEFGKKPLAGSGLALDLARLVLDRTYGTLIAFQAEEGRDEFAEAVERAGRSLLRVPLYRTVPSGSAADLAALPRGAFVTFASPSAFDVFFQLAAEAAGPEGVHRWMDQRELRLCAIGPTTKAAMLEKDCMPYATAEHPDLDGFIEELTK
jgi:hydroxymethylbilane synthase